MTERWLPVPDWPGYQVSSEGRVRSVDRTLPDGRLAGGVTLRPSPNRRGYLHVTLSDGWRIRRVPVHRLVKLVFTGPPRGRQVRHLDDDKLNNRLSNLKYGTRKDNERDRKRNKEKRERERRGRGREGIYREKGPVGYRVPQGVDRAVDSPARPGRGDSGC